MTATVRSSTAATATNSPTSPSDVVVGDLVLVIHWTRGGAGVPTHTLQGGFTEIRSHSHNDGSTDGRLSLAYKIATSSGATAYHAYTSDTGTDYAGIVVVTKDTYDPRVGKIGDVSNSVTQTTNALIDPGSIVTPVADCMVLAIAAWHLSAAAVVTVTPPTGYTEIWEMAGSLDSELSVARKTVATATTEDPGTFGDDVAPNGSASITVAFRPAGPIEGVAAGSGTATGALSGTGALSATGDGVGSATGALGGVGAVAGTAAGTGTATGDVANFVSGPVYRASFAGGGTTGTGNRTCTATPVVGDFWLVYCVVSSNTNTAPTCSDDNGGAYVLIDTASFTISGIPNMMSVFRRTTLLSNTTSTIVTPDTGSNDSGGVYVVAFTGITRTNATVIRSKGKQEEQASGTAPAPTLNQNALTTNITVGCIGGAFQISPPTNWTERQDTGPGSPVVSAEIVTRNSGFAGTQVTWPSTELTEFASHILELDGSAPFELEGTVSATGSATATVGGLIAAAGTAAGVGTATGALGGSGALTGTATGTGTVTGALAGSGALASSASSVGSASGALTGAGALAGTATAVGSATGTGQRAIAANGTAAGIGAATGALIGTGALAGTAAALGAGSGALAGAGALAGNVVALGSSVGALVGSGALASLATTAGTAFGSLGGTGAFAGVAAGIGTATATGERYGFITGAATGTGTATGTTIGVSLFAAGVGTGASSGALTGSAALTGTVTAIGSTSGELMGAGVLQGIVAALALAAGLALGVGSLVGNTEGVGEATAALVGSGAASGSAAAVALATGTPDGSIQVFGTASAFGSAIGDCDVTLSAQYVVDVVGTASSGYRKTFA